MNTPWGKADHICKLAEGVYSVGTPSHGGLMVRKEVAGRDLTDAAYRRGDPFGDFMAYEEDCDFCIPMFEREDWLLTWNQMEGGTTTTKRLFHSLSAWNADYLLARGLQPEPEGYAYWLKMVEDKRRRAAGDADLIVAAWGEWYTKQPDVTEVATADGKHHFVTDDSYAKVDPNLRLLSACILTS